MSKPAKKYIIIRTSHRTMSKSESDPKTIPEIVEAYGYTLECGASYAHEKGNAKINRNPKNIVSLVRNLNNAVNNSAANGYAGVSYNFRLVSN